MYTILQPGSGMLASNDIYCFSFTSVLLSCRPSFFKSFSSDRQGIEKVSHLVYVTVICFFTANIVNNSCLYMVFVYIITSKSQLHEKCYLHIGLFK